MGVSSWFVFAEIYMFGFLIWLLAMLNDINLTIELSLGFPLY